VTIIGKEFKTSQQCLVHATPDSRRRYEVLVVVQFGDGRLDGMCWLDPFSFSRENTVRHSKFLLLIHLSASLSRCHSQISDFCLELRQCVNLVMKNSMACFGWTLFRIHAKILHDLLICFAHSSQRFAVPIPSPEQRRLSGIAAVCQFGDKQLDGMCWLDSFSFPRENTARHSDLFCSFISARCCSDSIPRASSAVWNCGSVFVWS